MASEVASTCCYHETDQGQHLFLLHGLPDRSQGTWVGGLVVHDDQVDLLAFHPSSRIDLVEGEVDGFEFVNALSRPGTREVRCETDPNLLSRRGDAAADRCHHH
jgi:hypothetical protein